MIKIFSTGKGFLLVKRLCLDYKAFSFSNTMSETKKVVKTTITVVLTLIGLLFAFSVLFWIYLAFKSN